MIASVGTIAAALKHDEIGRENLREFGTFNGDAVPATVVAAVGKLLDVAPPEATRDTKGDARAKASREPAPDRTTIGRPLDVERMLREPPPEVLWRVHNFIPSGSLVMVFGEPGCGKSLLSATLGAASVRGDSLAGMTTAEGPVLYIDAENGEYEIHRRVRSLDIPDAGFHLRDGEAVDIAADADALRADIEKTGARLVVLDSLRALAPKLDENDPKSCEATLAPLRRLAHDTGAAIVVIHHARKGNGEYRGSTALLAALDAAFALARVEGDPDKARRRLACRKMRVAQEPEDRWLRIVAEGGAVLVEPAEPFDGTATSAPVVGELRAQVMGALPEGESLKLADVARAVDRHPKDGSVRNAVGSLVDEGVVLRGNDKRYRLAPGKGATDVHPPVVCTFAPFDGDPARSALQSGNQGVGKGANEGATGDALAPLSGGADPPGLAGEPVWA